VDEEFAPHEHEGEADSLSQLFRRVAYGINIPITDRTEPSEISKIRFRYDYRLIGPDIQGFPGRFKDREKELPILLGNLARQTGLKFKVERQPAQIWFVTEANGN